MTKIVILGAGIGGIPQAFELEHALGGGRKPVELEPLRRKPGIAFTAAGAKA